MTEDEWFASGNLSAMIRAIDPRRYDRSLRLFAVACCRRGWRLFPSDAVRHVIELSEEHADGRVELGELREASDRLSWHPGDMVAKYAAASNCASWQSSADSYLRAALHVVDVAVRPLPTGTAADRARRNERQWAENGAQLHLLRDTVGNPFRPVTFDLSWRTEPVVALARQMYEARDFGPMPVLADALDDAGCDAAEVLAHCRGDGPHVRGCWVLDLVLGRA